MPSSFNVGIATSALQVVGLHEPPRNTSTAASKPFVFELFFDLNSPTLFKDFVLRSSDEVVLLALLLHAVLNFLCSTGRAFKFITLSAAIEGEAVALLKLKIATVRL